MHNFYVPPFKVLFFAVMLVFTGFSARALQQKDVPIPKFDFHIASSTDEPVIENEAEIERPNLTWSKVQIQTNGADRKYGNIISMQVVLRIEDFAKTEWWNERIEELMLAGKTANIYDRKTIIIFPEHIGTGLIFLDEKEAVFSNDNWKSAMETFVSKHKADIAPFLEFSSKPQAKWEAAFRFQSQKMATAYQQTFAKLARDYKVPILAGSIILPSPKVVRGELVIDPKGPLYNVSVPFSADGKVMDPLIRKTLITQEEDLILSAGEVNQDRTWIVPGWKVAVFIGTEVFNPLLYEKLRGRPLDGLVSPAFSFANLDKERIKPYINDDSFLTFSDPDIWEKFGLTKNIKTTRAVESVQVFLKGNFFEEKAAGRTYNVRDFINYDSATSEVEPQILNLYF